MCLLVGVGTSWGADKTVTFTSFGNSSTSGSKDGVSYVTARGTNANGQDPLISGTQLRFYEGNTLTVSSTTDIIKKITFTTNSTASYGGGLFEYDDTKIAEPNSTTVAWDCSSLNSKSITLSASGAMRITGISVVIGGESAAKQKYVVTIQKPENGVLTIKDGTTTINSGDEVEEGKTLSVEVKANDGFRFKNWGYKDGDAAWVGNMTSTFTHVMPSAPCSFRATFEEIPTYTVAWSVNGTIVKTEDLKEGTEVTPPATPEDINDKTFTGWVTTPSVDADATPTYVTPSATATGNVTYYAVFATDNGGETELWVEVTSAPTEGTYAICSDDYFMKASVSSNRLQNGVEPKISDGQLTVAPSEDCIWEISKPDEYYRIKNGTSYAGGTGSKNQGALLTDASADMTKWSISYSDNKFEIINFGRSKATSDSSNKYLRNNSTYGWATYTSGTGKAPRLFKKSGGASYSDFTTIPEPSAPTFASLDQLIDANLEEPTVVNVTIDDVVAMAMVNPVSVAYIVSLKNSGVTLAAPGSNLGWKNGGTISGTLENVKWYPDDFMLTSETDYWSSLTYDYSAPSYDGTIDFVAAGEDGYYATFSSEEAVTIPAYIEVDDEYVYLSVYSVYAVGDMIELQDLTEGLTYDGAIWLSENEGYLIKAESTSEEYNFTGETAISVGYTNVGFELYGQDPENFLRPSSETMTGDNYFYKLAYKSGSNYDPATLGFYWGAANGGTFTVRDNSAYLVLPKENQAKGFSFVDLETTGIKNANTTVAGGNVMYNLAGQRVNKNAKGIVIINGKKMLNK